MFSLGLDKISSETETLAQTKQRNAAPKATGEPRKKLTDEDEDYEPKLTPGCPSAVLPSTVCFCAITGNLCYFPPCVSKKKSMYSFSDSESDDDFSEPPESEDEEFTVKKVNKSKKKEKVTKNEKTKQPPSSKKEKPASKSSKSKSQAAGKFVHRKRFKF